LFYDAFKEVGIEVVPLYAFGIFNLDFAIPDSKIAIEINGGNWHTSHRKRKQDMAKLKVLNSAGWYLISFDTHRKQINQVIQNSIGTLKSLSKIQPQ
jgi:very-short-patch-repair endonuclease